MRGGPRRPLYHLGILTMGFLLGGFMTALLRRFLPESPTKDFFTFAVQPSFGPAQIDLLVVNFTLGPVGLDVSLLSVVGVVLAYLVARTLF
ncbi:MAG: DUF4321 domain-containing protein [Gemmatimonadota bacterium]